MPDVETHYEICTEDSEGFNPREGSFASRDEAEMALSTYRRQWPGEKAFIVRTTMTKISESRNLLPLQLV